MSFLVFCAVLLLPPQMTRNIIKGRHKFFQVSNYSFPPFLSPLSSRQRRQQQQQHRRHCRVKPNQEGLSPCSALRRHASRRTDGWYVVCRIERETERPAAAVDVKSSPLLRWFSTVVVFSLPSRSLSLGSYISSRRATQGHLETRSP